MRCFHDLLCCQSCGCYFPLRNNKLKQYYLTHGFRDRFSNIFDLDSVKAMPARYSEPGFRHMWREVIVTWQELRLSLCLKWKRLWAKLCLQGRLETTLTRCYREKQDRHDKAGACATFSRRKDTTEATINGGVAFHCKFDLMLLCAKLTYTLIIRNVFRPRCRTWPCHMTLKPMRVFRPKLSSSCTYREPTTCDSTALL